MEGKMWRTVHESCWLINLADAFSTAEKISLNLLVTEDLLAHVHQGREVVKKTKKIKGMANKISSLIPGDFVVTTTTDVVDHKTLNQKMARR